MIKSIIRCRIEELPFLGEYVRDLLLHDHDDFIAFSPVFNDGYLSRYDAQLAHVNGVVAPSVVMAETKAFTRRIAGHYTTARDVVNRIERYAGMAWAETGKSINDFGFKKLRQEIGKRNDEAVVKLLRDLLQHTATVSSALEKQGFTPAYRQEVEAFIAAFGADVLAQERRKEEHSLRVKQNTGQFNILWSMISEIMDTGKVIYKGKDKARVKDYTYADLIRNVRRVRKKEEQQQSATTA